MNPYEIYDDGPGLVYGIRPVMEAVEAGKTIDKVLIASNADSPLMGGLKSLLKANGLNWHFVPVQKLNRVTRANHQGVICFISPIEFSSISQVLPGIYESGKDPLVVVLDKITDVRNFGSIVRSAECAGAHAVVIPERGAAQVNHDAVKTSAGALFRIPVCREKNLKETIEFLKASGLKVLACSEKGKTAYFNEDLKGGIAFLMGSEEEGISEEYLKRCDGHISIPMAGNIASLNVSVAAGVLLFEALRQKTQTVS